MKPSSHKKSFKRKVNSYYKRIAIRYKPLAPPKEVLILHFLIDNNGKAFTSESLVN